MASARPSAPAFGLVLSLVLPLGLACKAEAPIDGSATATTSGASTTGEGPETSATGTGAPMDPCACADPVVHVGDLDLPGLAAYEGACLVEIDGILTIKGAASPAALAPLQRLRRAGWLEIAESPGLVDAAPLGCLEEATRLYLRNNPSLADLSALSRVVRVEDVWIEGAPITALPTFAPDYQGIRKLRLDDLPKLVDLDASATWPGLHDVDIWDGLMEIEIRGAPALTSVAGLAGPLADAVALAPDDAFAGAVSVTLDDLPALASLVGLEPYAHGDLALRRLPALVDLTPLAGFTRAGALELAGLDGLSSLAGLGGLISADRLTIGGCDGAGMPALTALSGLDALIRIDYGLSIIDAPKLVGLAGAPKLIDVGSVELIDAPLLGDAEVAAFLAQVGSPPACVGGVIECGCQGTAPAVIAVGCPALWEGGSAVSGQSAGGAFDGATAFFGWEGPGGTWAALQLVLVDAGADIEAAKAAGLSGTEPGTPKVLIDSGREYPYWVSTSTVDALMVHPGDVSAVGPVKLEISGRLGRWDVSDPDDPPRLVGALSTSDPNAPVQLNGSFDAVFCDAFVRVLGD